MRLLKANWNRILLIFWPALFVGAISCCYGVLRSRLPFPMPQWNDEAAYYEMVKTCLETGPSLGYWGFEGGHAILGTGGAWHPAILLPYIFFGTMFGWGYSSVAYTNLVVLMLANTLFLLLTKADTKTTWRMFFLELFSCHILLYANTSMSEILRYAFAIILAGMFYRLYRENKKGIFAYVIVPLYLLYLLQVYIFFAFAVPVYVLLVYRRGKLWKRLSVAVLGQMLTAFPSYYLLHLISSNYNIYKTELLLNTLKSGDFLSVIKTFLWMAKTGVYDLLQCRKLHAGYGMFRWFIPFVCLFVIVSLVMGIWICKKGENKQDGIFFLIAGYSAGIYLFLYITLYSLEAFTLFRGLGIVLLFSMSGLVFLERRELFWRFLLCYGLGILFLPGNMKEFQAERYLTAEEVRGWDELGENLSGVMEPEKGGERWEKTVVLYTMEPKVIAAVPAGFGLNFAMRSEELVEEAGYLLFSLEKEENLRPDWLEQSYEQLRESFGGELEQNYDVVYQDDAYIVYARKRG